MRAALELIKACACDNGCPGCVHLAVNCSAVGLEEIGSTIEIK
jgi:hypothetical protein